MKIAGRGYKEIRYSTSESHQCPLQAGIPTSLFKNGTFDRLHPQRTRITSIVAHSKLHLLQQTHTHGKQGRRERELEPVVALLTPLLASCELHISPAGGHV